MANNAGDDIALLKEELAQFLLGEITSAQGGQAFRGEVSEQVAAVVDQILADRLRPTLDRVERAIQTVGGQGEPGAIHVSVLPRLA